MAKHRLRCRKCKAVAEIDTEAKTANLTYPRETSPYGGRYPHTSMAECPLTRGLAVDRLLAHPEVEAV